MDITTTPTAPTFDDIVAQGYFTVKILIPSTAIAPQHEEEFTVKLIDLLHYFRPVRLSGDETGGFAG